MDKEQQKKNPHSPDETRLALNRAFDRIFERYGSDFAAFFRDARAEVELRREAAQHVKLEAKG